MCGCLFLREDNSGRGELNLLARREVVTCYFSELPLPMEFYDNILYIMGEGVLKLQRSGNVALTEKREVEVYHPITYINELCQKKIPHFFCFQNPLLPTFLNGQVTHVRNKYLPDN